MTIRDFLKSLVAMAISPMVNLMPRAATIYDTNDAPKEFVKTFVWWAYHTCSNQKYTRLSCGAEEPVFTDSHLSVDCQERIEKECNEFWRMANQVIRKAKGRCNVHPSVDTDLHHVGSAGANFFFARNGDGFFIEYWPKMERDEFFKLAALFRPMLLREASGRLEFMEDVTPEWKLRWCKRVDR
jgi:hypothetical protein